MIEYEFIITNDGYSLLSELISERKPLNLNTIVLGDEYGILDKNRTDIVHEVDRLPIVKLEYLESSFKIYFEVDARILSDYYICEIGVANKSSNGNFVMFALGNISKISKPSGSNNNLKNLNFTLEFNIYNAQFSSMIVDSNIMVVDTDYSGKSSDLRVNSDNNFGLLNFTDAININHDNIGDISLINSDNVVDEINSVSEIIGNINLLKVENNLVKAINYISDRVLILGHIKFLSFDSGRLPFGWHLCDGSRYLLSSDIGKALNSLDEHLKYNFNINIVDNEIIIPNFFDGNRGYFMRSSLNAGEKNSDTLASHTHSYHQGSYTAIDDSGNGTNSIRVSNSTTGLVGNEETRPINIGMSPCIYLGV